jgi:outer membrane biosynthesis protein TonB
MSSPRFLVPLLVLAALLASGCGSSSKKELLTQREASRLENAVNDADRLVDDNRCDAARDAALKGSTQAQNLPKHVSSELQANLVDGFEHLVQQIEQECKRPEKTPTPTPSPSPTATPTEEPTAEPTPTPTEEPTPTPTPTATPGVTVTPDSGGASGDPGNLEDQGA